MITPPFIKELFSLYSLVPLSTFSPMVDFFDNSDVEDIITFEDIMLTDVGGVGLGEKSV